jgi:hypothetical protein
MAEMGKPNVEVIRDLTVSVRKTGINVKRWADGYRMINLLENVGINGKTEGYGCNGNNDSDANKEIILLLQEIYLPCKKSGFSPPIVFSRVGVFIVSVANRYKVPCYVNISK